MSDTWFNRPMTADDMPLEDQIEGKSIVRQMFRCPFCYQWRDAVEEFDGFSPETRLAPTAECKDCEIKMIAPYGVVHIYSQDNPRGTIYPVPVRRVAVRLAE